MRQLYRLDSMVEDPAIPDRNWLDANRPLNVLPCRHWRPGVIDPIVLASTGEPAALSFVAGAAPGNLIHDDLRSLLNPEFDALVQTSSVILSDGSPTNFRAYWPNWSKGIRGDAKSYCYFCETCQHLYYTPMGDKNYILQCDIPPDSIFVESGEHIVVDDLVRDRLWKATLRKTVLTQIIVRDTPIDGFPIDLTNLPREMERRYIPWSKRKHLD